jgi:antitoxin component YwqK of YwqJK toxin-antitoxin module
MKRVHFTDTTSPTGDGTYILVDGELYTGVVDTADDGTILSLNTYQDGLEHGPQREFHHDGTPSNFYEAVSGHPVGESHQWDDDGNPTRRRVFSDSGRLLEDDGED